jgi:hypothetical protein
VAALEALFAETKFPSEPRRKEVGDTIGLSERQVSSTAHRLLGGHEHVACCSTRRETRTVGPGGSRGRVLRRTQRVWQRTGVGQPWAESALS